MDLQNLAYALTQVVHNFGAVTVVGGALYGRSLPGAAPSAQQRMVWLVLVAWTVQAVSGAGFGAISYAYYGQLPDIHGVASAALYLKMTCVFTGLLLAMSMLRNQPRWPGARQAMVWSGQALLGVVALTAAAFLRWFS